MRFQKLGIGTKIAISVEKELPETQLGVIVSTKFIKNLTAADLQRTRKFQLRAGSWRAVYSKNLQKGETLVDEIRESRNSKNDKTHDTKNQTEDTKKWEKTDSGSTRKIAKIGNCPETQNYLSQN